MKRSILYISILALCLSVSCKSDKKEDANPKAMDKYADGKEIPSYIYSVEFEKPGGLVMPLIVELTYADGSTERQTFPAQIWMKNVSINEKKSRMSVFVCQHIIISIPTGIKSIGLGNCKKI